MNSGAYSTPTKQKTSASPPSSATISGSDSGDGNCSTGSNRRSSRSPAMGSNDTHSNSNSDRSNNELRQKVERFVMKKKLTSERKKQLESEKKYEEVVELTRKWNKDIIPNWSSKYSCNEVRQLCMRGIPSSVRGRVWPLLVGNDLMIMGDTYQHLKLIAERKLVAAASAANDGDVDVCRDELLHTSSSCNSSDQNEIVVIANELVIIKAVSVYGKEDDECSVVEPRVITQQPTVMCVDEAGSTPRKASSVYLQIESDEEEGDADVDATAATARGNMYVYDAGHTPKHLSPHHQTSDMEQKVPSLNNMELIQYDLPRTFPTLGFFHDGGTLYVGLKQVLQSYAVFKPDIGYVQGMSYIVAVLLLYMDEVQAFQCLCNLIHKRGHMDFYRLKKDSIDKYVMLFNHFFQEHLPLLYEHLHIVGVTSDMFLLDWNLSLFAKALPLEVTARLWDIYLNEGEVFVIRAALGILKMYALELSKMTLESVMKLLVHLPANINASALVKYIDQIKISNDKYNKIRSKYYTTVGTSSTSDSSSSSSSSSSSNSSSSSRSMSKYKGSTYCSDRDRSAATTSNDIVTSNVFSTGWRPFQILKSIFKRV